VHEDVQYQVDAGFSRIVMWDNIKHNTPSKLKVSPLAVVPQPNRRGRLILDLSFPVHQRSQQSKRKLGQVIQAAVNDTTTPLAPEKPVNELGKVLLRIFDFMLEVPAGETINFSKLTYPMASGGWLSKPRTPGTLHMCCLIHRGPRYALLSHMPYRWGGLRVLPFSVQPPKPHEMYSRFSWIQRQTCPPILSLTT
jgi:hypothetical protein